MIKQFGVNFKAELITKLKEKLEGSHRMKSVNSSNKINTTYIHHQKA